MKVLKFSADFCQPCKMLAKTLADIDPSSIPEVVSIDIETDYKLAQKFDVRAVPTLILVDSEEQELKRASGYMTESKFLDFVRV